jgi:hypothetical protein
MFGWSRRNILTDGDLPEEKSIQLEHMRSLRAEEPALDPDELEPCYCEKVDDPTHQYLALVERNERQFGLNRNDLVEGGNRSPKGMNLVTLDIELQMYTFVIRQDGWSDRVEPGYRYLGGTDISGTGVCILMPTQHREHRATDRIAGDIQDHGAVSLSYGKSACFPHRITPGPSLQFIKGIWERLEGNDTSSVPI